MKCFTLTKTEVLKGITKDLLPTTPELFKQTEGCVEEATIVPVTPERDGIDFVELFKKDIQAAIAVCDVIFDVPSKKDKTNRCLIGYDPRDWYPLKSKGDLSVLIYRSSSLFIAMGNVNELILASTANDNREAHLSKEGPCIKEGNRILKQIPKREDYFVAYLH